MEFPLLEFTEHLLGAGAALATEAAVRPSSEGSSRKIDSLIWVAAGN